MGVCESPNSNKSNIKNKRNLNTLSTKVTNFSSKEKSTSNIKYEKGEYILPESLSKRDDINKYYNISSEILGEGSSGTVCLGENSKGKYAIKRINKSKIKNIDDIIKEAKFSKLKHKNIIKYYEIYEDLKSISFVMELGQGGDLYDFIVNSPIEHLPLDLCIDLTYQILDVLNYLHNEIGIMHRDLKPENVMIKIDKFNKPQIKLIDFGLATYIPKNGQKLKEIIGTKEYAAPEIFDRSGYSEKIDEWAIGVIMFNMLTGLEPFKGDNTGEIKDSVLFGNVKFNYIEDVELRELDKKLLNRYVAKRITCKEALQELKTIKVDRENYYKGQKRLVKKTASVILKKEYEEVKEYSQYWDSLSSKVGGINFI